MKIVRSGDFKIMFNEKNRLFNASMLFDQLDGGEDALRDLLDSRKDLRRLITKRSFWIDMPAIALFLGDYDGDDIKRLVFDCASCYISHSIVAFWIFLFFVIIAMSFFMIMGKMVMIQARPCLALLIYPPVS